jgi:8-oxo-dGTP pyrophosphatase MutT (NUDIX family)
MTEAVNEARPGTMRDAALVKTDILLPEPKRFIREVLVMPDGNEIDWYYIDTPPSVLIVPVTAEGTVVMVRQWRHNLKRHTLEFPAGTVSTGEELEQAVERELREETGFALAPGGELRPLGAFVSLPSETNKYTHMFLASPVVAVGPAAGDAEIEKYFDMSVEIRPRQEVLAAIGSVVVGTESVTAFMLAQRELENDRLPGEKARRLITVAAADLSGMAAMEPERFGPMSAAELSKAVKRLVDLYMPGLVARSLTICPWPPGSVPTAGAVHRRGGDRNRRQAAGAAAPGAARISRIRWRHNASHSGGAVLPTAAARSCMATSPCAAT